MNPAMSYLIFINGTDPDDVRFFRSLHARFEKKKIKLKILAFVDSKVEIQDFGMALYTRSGITWNDLPKKKLIELVNSREFDVLFHLNPEELPHLHFLAVAAKANFKISTLTTLPNNFNLTVKSKSKLSLPEKFEDMNTVLEKLSIR